MPAIHIDFETRSAADLKSLGVHAYAKDPSTDAWCMAWAIDDEPVSLWRRAEFQSAARAWEGLLAHSDAVFIAHNATFEHVIWNSLMVPRYGWPPLPIERMRCTMAMSYAMALPASLENAAAAVGITARKDMDGRKVMERLMKPRRREEDGSYTWWADNEKLDRLYAYCKQDVAVERELHKRILDLSPAEQELWFIDQRINARGFCVDIPAIGSAIAVVDETKKTLDEEMARVTKGRVQACTQVAELTEWLKSRGVEVDSVAKPIVAALLEREGVPEDVKRALVLRQEAGKSSVAKLKAMLSRADPHDGRVRGTLQFHGANTGRWAGRGVQPQNFPRPTLPTETIEEVVDYLSLMG